MRIPFKYAFNFFKTKSSRFDLVFEKRFSTKENFVSLGSACHPAHMLEALKFRKQSLPFDWLLTDPIRGMEYVCENIRNKFSNFTADLKLNSENKAFAARYPFSCFFHHTIIMSDKNALATMNKRCERFLDVFKNINCTFLYSAVSSFLSSNEATDKLIASVKDFMTLAKPSDKLLVYINCDESADENKEFCDKVITELNKLNNVRCTRFVLGVKKYGLWGYENNYSLLFAELGIKLRPTLPGIYFKRTDLIQREELIPA